MPPRIDLTGQRFGELEVIQLSETRHKTGTRMWECKCHACGNTTLVLGYALRHGHYKSCGCIQPVKRDRGVKAHIKTDCVDGTRKSALRVKPHRDSKSGIKGVTWVESRKRWLAYIGFRGKQINLGYYVDKDDAIAARKRAEEKYHQPILEENNKSRSRKRLDPIGEVYGFLKVLKEIEQRGKTRRFLCECLRCGNVVPVALTSLRSGNTKSCGCVGKGRPAADLTGREFGELKVLGRAQKKSKYGVMWTCECSCGKIKDVLGSSLISGATKSCGHSKTGIVAKDRTEYHRMYKRLMARKKKEDENEPKT